MNQKKTALIELLKDGIPRSKKEILLAMNRYDISDHVIRNYLKELTHNGSLKTQFVTRENEICATHIYFASDEDGRKVSFFGCKNIQTDGMVYKAGCNQCYNVKGCESYKYLFENSNG